MKTYSSIRLALIALSGALIIPALSASNTSSAAPAATDTSPPIAAVRAKSEIGADVFAADGTRVGSVVDYVLQFNALPQLRYVIVNSSASAGKQAQQRAIPADAITMVDNQVRVSLASEAFAQLPVMTANHRAFLSSADNQATLAKLAGTPLAHAELTDGFVVYSELTELFPVVGKKGEELGYFSDIWIDLNANEAPYLEYAPDGGPLDLFGGTEYNVPTTALTSVKMGEIHVALDDSDLEHLRSLDDAAPYVAAVGEKLENIQVKSGL